MRKSLRVGKIKNRNYPKVEKPTTAELRTDTDKCGLQNVHDYDWKKNQRKNVGEHQVNKETQEIFTKGGEIECNIFILKYFMEDSIRRKKSLIVTSVDFAKPFDSLKREDIIKTL